MTSNVNKNNNKNKSDVHYLPCNIEYDGIAQISTYFKVKPLNDVENNNLFISSFRGRELKGISIDLPNELSGYTFNKNKIDDNKVFELSNSFDNITYWQHDVIPTENALNDQFQWFEISNAIHSDD